MWILQLFLSYINLLLKLFPHKHDTVGGEITIVYFQEQAMRNLSLLEHPQEGVVKVQSHLPAGSLKYASRKNAARHKGKSTLGYICVHLSKCMSLILDCF